MRKHGRLPDIRTGNPVVDSALQRQRVAIEQALGGTWDGNTGLALEGTSGLQVTTKSGGGNQVAIAAGGVDASHLAAGAVGSGLTGGAGSPVSLNITRESIGTGDGATTAFALSGTPMASGEMIFLDGVLQMGGYSIAGSTVTFTVAPGAGVAVFAVYFK